MDEYEAEPILSIVNETAGLSGTACINKGSINKHEVKSSQRRHLNVQDGSTSQFNECKVIKNIWS